MTTPRAARRRTAALALTAGLALAPFAATASADDADDALTLTPLGTYSTGAFAEGASEIVAYDPRHHRAFVVNAHAGTVDVLDISDPTAPTKAATLDTPGANSVDVRHGVVAVAQQADDKTDPGTVAFFDAATLTRTGDVTVGALPDMVTITDNGRYALVANEGEPEGYCEGQVDPEGSISVIDLRRGAARATVRTADFRAFNGAADALRAAGVRIYGPGGTVAQDLEPEYITVSTDKRTAYVSLQEANAIAVVDIASATVTDVRPLGLKDHSLPGQGLDASDKDGAINIATWPVKGMYQPDAIAAFKAKGREYLVTANEGDARDWDCYAEEERIADLPLSPSAFPGAKKLQDKKALGRLNATITSPQDAAAGYTELHVLGGRSVSVRDASTGALVWDSGDQLERLVAERAPELFNANHEEDDSFDTRSDNKGPEPEGLDVGKIEGRTYAFVGLERVSGLVAVDVSDPRRASLAGFGLNRDPDGEAAAGTAGDLGPEGVHFVTAGESPTGRPLVLVGNEISGTTTVWEVAGR
jgi:hypothetical protein